MALLVASALSPQHRPASLSVIPFLLGFLFVFPYARLDVPQGLVSVLFLFAPPRFPPE